MDYKQQINDARNERETGDLNKALEMFLQINRDQLEPNQLFNYLGELGLTYWHLKRYDEARETFEDAKSQAEKSENSSQLALAFRQLSRPELNENNPSTAVEYAKKARELAKEAGRQDIAWFDHGVVTALIFNKNSQEEIREWFEIEAKDLYEVSRDIDDDVAKWVWVIGLLMDRAKIFNTIGDLYIAQMIADQFSLNRRKEQIEQMIQEFNN
jgi:tetratricopeptide (TPR) repeat protein